MLKRYGPIAEYDGDSRFENTHPHGELGYYMLNLLCSMFHTTIYF